jgi:hypothetical protein
VDAARACKEAAAGENKRFQAQPEAGRGKGEGGEKGRTTVRERTADPVAAPRIAHLESLPVAHKGGIRERANKKTGRHARVGAPSWRAGAQRAHTFPSPYGDAPAS